MALRGFDQLSANELSALLGAHSGQNSNSNPMARLLFAQQQQQLQQQQLQQQQLQQQQLQQLQQQQLQQQQLQQQQQQGHHSNLASLAALNAGNMTSAQQFASMNAGIGQNNNALSSLSSEQQYQSQTTQLLTALLEQQQREDKRKADLIAQLNNVLQNNAHQQVVPPPSDNLAMLLQQKQMALANRSIGNPTIGNPTIGNSLSHLSGSPHHIMGGSGSMFGGQPKTDGQMNAAVIAKYLQSQQYPQQPQPTIHQQNPLQQTQQQTQQSSAASCCVVSVAPSQGSGSSAYSSSYMSGSAAGPLGADGMAAPADRRRKGRTGTFPQKLHQMLSDLERQDGGTDIASFLPHGRAFAIHKPRDFVKHVMPKYFRMSRFSSFQRQLNLYDFQRITEGPDKGSYYHELFVQGRPILSTMMKRNKIKGVKSLKNLEGEGEGEEDKAEEKEETPLKEDEDAEEDEDDVE